MVTETRRSLLRVVAPVIILPLSGCANTSNGDGAGDADGNGTPLDTTESQTDTLSRTEPEIEQYLEISDLRWVSYYLRFNVENVSETDLGFVQVDSAVYEGDTRIGTMYTNIGELAGGTNVDAEIDYTATEVDGSLCDGTRYTITPTVNVDANSLEHTYAYAESPCGSGSTTT